MAPSDLHFAAKPALSSAEMDDASALVTEATARMHAQGIAVARLHVNTNNPGALATWRRLGWHESGRRGRFERAATRAGDP